MDWLFPTKNIQPVTHEFRVNVAANYMSANTDYMKEYFGLKDSLVNLSDSASKEDKQEAIDQLNRYHTIRGCYLGLFLQGVPLETVQKAMENNHLTELFDIVYKETPCRHYERFTMNEFVIDNGKEKGDDLEYLEKLNVKKQKPE